MELKAENVKNIQSLSVCKEFLRQAIEQNDQLNAEIDRLQKWNKKETKLRMDIERRQKYKRCFAMANWCFMKSNYHYLVGREEGGQLAKDSFRRSNLYLKWCDRWQRLAEQFKEDK